MEEIFSIQLFVIGSNNKILRFTTFLVFPLFGGLYSVVVRSHSWFYAQGSLRQCYRDSMWC